MRDSQQTDERLLLLLLLILCLNEVKLDRWVISTVDKNVMSVTSVLFMFCMTAFLSVWAVIIMNTVSDLLLVITFRSSRLNESTLGLCPEAHRLQIIVGNLG